MQIWLPLYHMISFVCSVLRPTLGKIKTTFACSRHRYLECFLFLSLHYYYWLSFSLKIRSTSKIVTTKSTMITTSLHFMWHSCWFVALFTDPGLGLWVGNETPCCNVANCHTVWILRSYTSLQNGHIQYSWITSSSSCRQKVVNRWCVLFSCWFLLLIHKVNLRIM